MAWRPVRTGPASYEHRFNAKLTMPAAGARKTTAAKGLEMATTCTAIPLHNRAKRAGAIAAALAAALAMSIAAPTANGAESPSSEIPFAGPPDFAFGGPSARPRIACRRICVKTRSQGNRGAPMCIQWRSVC
jgi:hypothetical protein